MTWRSAGCCILVMLQHSLTAAHGWEDRVYRFIGKSSYASTPGSPKRLVGVGWWSCTRACCSCGRRGFDASRREKKMRSPSRDKKCKAAYRSGEGGRRAYHVTLDLAYDYLACRRDQEKKDKDRWDEKTKKEVLQVEERMYRYIQQYRKLAKRGNRSQEPQPKNTKRR